MRILQLSRSGPPLSLSDLSDFEEEIDAKLPQDYKWFLLNQNGGIASHVTIQYKYKNQSINVRGFYKLEAKSDAGLRREAADFLRFTKSYVPVAGDIHTEVCVSVDPDKAGVYLVTVDDNNDDPYIASAKRIEDSFSKFLTNVVETVWPQDDIEELCEKGTVSDLESHLSIGRSIDELSIRGFSILREAIKNDNLPVIQACIDRGASLSQTIYTAVKFQKPHLIDLLVEAGADVNEPNERGQTPLKAVIGTKLPGEKGELNRELRDVLLKHGAAKK